MPFVPTETKYTIYPQPGSDFSPFLHSYYIAPKTILRKK